MPLLIRRASPIAEFGGNSKNEAADDAMIALRAQRSARARKSYCRQTLVQVCVVVVVDQCMSFHLSVHLFAFKGARMLPQSGKPKTNE